MRLLALFITLALLGGCEDEAERRRVRVAEEHTELLRLNDPAHAYNELRKRILQNLKLSTPHIAIWVNNMDARVIPASTPWTVRCDEISGLSIAFTTSLTDWAGGLEMRLTEARPNKEQCLDLAVATAKVLDAILAGR